MNKRIINNGVVAENDVQLPSELDEIVRAGARQMLIAALEAEVETDIQAHQAERDKTGRALVVRHGKAQERKILCGAGSINVQAPRVNDKWPGKKFTNHILPPYLRRSPQFGNGRACLVFTGLIHG